MPRPQPKPITGDRADEVERRYHLGFSIREICLRVGTSDRAVRNVLTARQIPIRDTGGYRLASPLVTPEVVAKARAVSIDRCRKSGESFAATLSAYAWEIDVPRQPLRSAFDTIPVINHPQIHAADRAMREATLRQIEAWDRGERRPEANPWPTCSSLA